MLDVFWYVFPADLHMALPITPRTASYRIGGKNRHRPSVLQTSERDVP